jgi:hypothetical protein
MNSEYLKQIDSITNGKYKLEARVLIQAVGEVNYSLKPSIFVDFNAENWSVVNSCFYFPLRYNTIENAFLAAINSEKNINTYYSAVRNIKIVNVFYVNEKGYTKGEIK